MLNINTEVSEKREVTDFEKNQFKNFSAKIGLAIIVIALNNIIMPNLYLIILDLTGLMEVLTKINSYFAFWFFNDLCAYLAPIIACLIIFREERKTPYIGHYKSVFMDTYILFPAMLTTGSLATSLTQHAAEFFDSIFGTGEIPDAMSSVAPSTQVEMIIYLVFVVLIGPVFEEILFRGAFLMPLRKYGDGFAVALSAVVFGLFHGNFDQFPYALAVGLFLGLAAVKSNSILPPIILHVLNNLLVSLSNYASAFKTGGANDAIFDTIENLFSVILYVLFFLGFIALVLVFFAKIYKTEDAFPIRPLEKFKLFMRNPFTVVGIILFAVTFFI